MFGSSYLSGIGGDAAGWSAAHPAAALAGGLIGALSVAALLALRSRGRPGGAPADAGTAGRGAARAPRELSFRLEGGRLEPMTRVARRFLRAVADDAAGALARRLRPLTGPADLGEALDELERRGAAFRMLAEANDGAVWEVRGGTAAGEAHLTLAPSAPAEREIARLRAELAETRAERDAALEIAEKAPALMWRRAPDGALAWANARYRAVSGEAAGAPAELTMAAATGREVAVAGGAAAPAEAVQGRRALFDARTGERLWHDVSSRPAADGGRLGYALDAAAAVHAEGVLRRFVETLTETFAHLRVGLAIFDREQRLGLFNPAFGEMMRLDPAWLAGRPMLGDVLVRLREARMTPEQANFAEWRRELSEMFGDAPPQARRDRTEIWQLPGEVMIKVAARPHPQGAVAFLFEDVSETARLERRWLTETETRRAVMDRLEEAVAAFGPDGRARFANPAFARIWGFRPGEDGAPLRLRDALERFAARTGATPAWRRLASFAEGEGPRAPWSEMIATRDGRRLWARVAALPDGSVLTAFSDVTDAARAEQALRDRNLALEEAEEIRGALIEQMSRRVRTPLNTIAGFGQMLRDGAGGRPLSTRQRGYADGIMSAAAEIEDAMGGVADLASAQSGAIAIGSGPVDLGAALTAALDQARRAADRRGVRLTVERTREAGAEAVAGDAKRVRQILFNLLADAVQRSAPGAEVRAGVRRNGERMEIWTDEPAVEFAGEGPAPVRRGLAHALVRRFAELHGGEVRVERTAAGAGAGAEDGGAAERLLPFGEPGAGAPRVRVVCALPVAAVTGEALAARPEVA